MWKSSPNWAKTRHEAALGQQNTTISALQHLGSKEGLNAMSTEEGWGSGFEICCLGELEVLES